MCYNVSPPSVTGVKWNKQKQKNYNSKIEENEKSLLKINVPTEIEHNGIKINIKEHHCSVNEVCSFM